MPLVATSTAATETIIKVGEVVVCALGGGERRRRRRRKAHVVTDVGVCKGRFIFTERPLCE